MKKTYPTSDKVKGGSGYCKHLRPFAKRKANKSTRREFKKEDKGEN